MKLSIEFTAGLHILVKRQIDNFFQIVDEQLSKFNFILSNIFVEFDQRCQYFLIADGNIFNSLYFFKHNIDVVGRLDGLIVPRMHFMHIFLQHIDILNEGTLLHLTLIDHEDGYRLTFGGTPVEQMHILVCNYHIADDVILDLLSFYLHYILIMNAKYD